MGRAEGGTLVSGMLKCHFPSRTFPIALQFQALQSNFLPDGKNLGFSVHLAGAPSPARPLLSSVPCHFSEPGLPGLWLAGDHADLPRWSEVLPGHA